MTTIGQHGKGSECEELTELEELGKFYACDLNPLFWLNIESRQEYTILTKLLEKPLDILIFSVMF